MLTVSKWLLLDSKTNVKIGPLSYFEAWKFISKLTPANIDHIVAMDANSLTSTWTQLSEVECFTDIVRRVLGADRHLSPYQTLLAQLAKADKTKIKLRRPLRDLMKSTATNTDNEVRDRRRFTRVPLAFPMTISAADGLQKDVYCLNISLGGAKLSKKFPKSFCGQRVRVKLEVHDFDHSFTIDVPARITNKNTDTSRLIFDENLEPSKRESIQQLISQHLEGYLQNTAA
ncbi:PilZ domain-containing protein [bacterium]|nr:PilZ domain-containing protein [bacterium]